MFAIESGNRSQRGQVIILFAMMLVVLLGMAALVVDLGQVYVVRRNLQNTADLAALAGSWELPNMAAAQSTAMTPVAANSPAATATVGPPTSGAYAGSGQAIQVSLSQEVPHLYAPILGRSSTVVRASATALLKPGGGGPKVLTALGVDPVAVEMSGTAEANIEGGLWSNGGVCAGGSTDLVLTGALDAALGVQDGPGCDADNVAAPSIGQPPAGIRDPLRDVPRPPPCDTFDCAAGKPAGYSWQSVGSTPEADGWIKLMPGFYRDITLSSSNKYKFYPGVYFVLPDNPNDGVDLSGDVVGVSGDSDDPDDAFALTEPNEDHPWGGVTFYVLGSRAQFNSNGVIKLAAAEPGGWHRIIVWMVDGSNQPAGQAGVLLNGGCDFSLLGTIYAPRTEVKLSGSCGYGNSPVEGSVVALSIELIGTATINLTYNSEYTTPWPDQGVLVE